MTKLTRRELLAIAGALAWSPSVTAYSGVRRTTSTPILVSVFLRGGLDALNVVAPVNDANYASYRVPEMRVLETGRNAGIHLDGAGPNIDFRLHPEAGPLFDLFQSGRMAFVHAAGLQEHNRSHFEAQDLVERGLAHRAELIQHPGGWIARWLAAAGAGSSLAVATTEAIPVSLASHNRTICAPEIVNGLPLPGGRSTEAVLSRIGQGPGSAYSAGLARLLADVKLVNGRMLRHDGSLPAYASANSANYGTSGIGRSLQGVARVIKLELGIRAFAVDMGGFDTHAQQGPRLARLLRDLSRALLAFHDDMAEWLDRIVLVVMSEFGRRVRSNASLGTDHGSGGVVIISAPGIVGGKVHGAWPGLAPEQLRAGTDLAVTSDIRSVLSELMLGPLATPSAPKFVFPGFSIGPVGFAIAR